MIGAIKAILQRGQRAMDISLHLGAHRCATTTFQSYLDQNRVVLRDSGVAVWTPENTRAGLFEGLICQPGQEDAGQIDVVRNVANGLDAKQLLVSEENMIGTPRNNLNMHALYPELSPRLERFQRALGHGVKRIGLAIRSYESYWVSAMSYAAMRGQPLPGRGQCAMLAVQPRMWTHIAQDIRALFPGIPLHVWVFEVFAGRPRRQFNILSDRTDIAHMLDQTPAWKNTSRNTRQLRHRLRMQGRAADLAQLPKGKQPWMPFTPLERQHLAAQYSDDMTYFRSGADPLIQFTENAAIKVLRRKNTQASPAFDTGEYDGSQAKMG